MQEKETNKGEKKPYVKPELVTHGSVAELTQKRPGQPVKGDPGSHIFQW